MELAMSTMPIPAAGSTCYNVGFYDILFTDIGLSYGG